MAWNERHRADPTVRKHERRCFGFGLPKRESAAECNYDVLWRIVESSDNDPSRPRSFDPLRLSRENFERSNSYRMDRGYLEPGHGVLEGVSRMCSLLCGGSVTPLQTQPASLDTR